jgi:hypothetical protein
LGWKSSESLDEFKAKAYIYLYFNYKRKNRWWDRMSPYEILTSDEEKHRFRRY